MLSSEEQKKSFTDRLALTTVSGDEYIIMPNATAPAFLVPISDKDIYKKALALIKPISDKGEIKKHVLSYIPPKWLKKKLSHIEFCRNEENDRYSIIFPWSQKICDKLTYISFNREMTDITVHKYAFTKEAREMVRNEHSFLSRIDTSNSMGIQIPKIKGFEDSDDYTCLLQDYVDGIHMTAISPSVSSFFSSLNSNEIQPLEKHPYIVNRMPLIKNVLLEFGQTKLLEELGKLYQKFKLEKFYVATMHSDFSSSNTVRTSNNDCVIIDWEDACEDGVCIDTEYFKFRKTIQSKESWMIKTAEQFLAVFHYIYFMAKKKNNKMLLKFNLDSEHFKLVKAT